MTKHNIEFDSMEVAYLYGLVRGVRKHLPDSAPRDYIDDIITKLQLVYNDIMKRNVQ
jgi:hypothetical protein